MCSLNVVRNKAKEELVNNVEDAPVEAIVVHEVNVNPGAAVQSARKDAVEKRRDRSSNSRNTTVKFNQL